jgi:hypothetical protein
MLRRVLVRPIQGSLLFGCYEEISLTSTLYFFQRPPGLITGCVRVTVFFQETHIGCNTTAFAHDTDYIGRKYDSARAYVRWSAAPWSLRP